MLVIFILRSSAACVSGGISASKDPLFSVLSTRVYSICGCTTSILTCDPTSPTLSQRIVCVVPASQVSPPFGLITVNDTGGGVGVEVGVGVGDGEDVGVGVGEGEGDGVGEGMD